MVEIPEAEHDDYPTGARVVTYGDGNGESGASAGTSGKVSDLINRADRLFALAAEAAKRK